MLKSLQASFAIAVAAAAATSSLRAQSPVPEATPGPILGGPATAAAPTPVSTAADSMTKAVETTPKERPVRKAVLEKYDANKNGVLDPAERAEFERDAPARKAERIKKYDKNGDGKLDAAERVAMKVERLREADAAKKTEKK